MAARGSIKYTLHAETAIRERGLDKAWVEKVARTPEWREDDPSNPDVERRFGAIPERGDRILRVVIVETLDQIRILSAFFDRRARRPT